MSIDPDLIERLIANIYDASLDDRMWTDIAGKLGILFGGSAVAIDIRASSRDPTFITAETCFDPSLRDLHFEEYDRPESNPGLAALLSAKIAKPFHSSSFITKEVYQSDPAVRAILHPQKFDKVLLVALERTQEAFSFINLFRRTSDQDFSPEDYKAFTLVSEHITRSLKFRQMHIARNCQQTTAAFTAESGHDLQGTLVITGTGHLIDADPGAQIILEAEGGLIVRGGKLTSVSKQSGEDNESLQRFLSGQYRKLPYFVVSLPNETFVSLECLPVSSMPLSSSNGHCLFTIIRLIPTKRRTDTRLFAQAYHLTKAESKVVAALAQTANATQAAALLGIGRETVKSHLTNIYDKSGTHSLSQLMLMIGQFAR